MMFESENRGSEQPKGKIPGYVKMGVLIGAVVAIYLGYIFYVRWEQNRGFQQRQAQQAAGRSEADRKTVEAMGGDRFEILRFYASPPEVKRGDDTQLCYGVSNAKDVTLEPQTNPVWPAYSRCVTVSPKKTTEYTLTATDANGQTKQSKITVEVR